MGLREEEGIPLAEHFRRWEKDEQQKMEANGRMRRVKANRLKYGRPFGPSDVEVGGGNRQQQLQRVVPRFHGYVRMEFAHLRKIRKRRMKIGSLKMVECQGSRRRIDRLNSWVANKRFNGRSGKSKVFKDFNGRRNHTCVQARVKGF
jgi:hypothetical protein